MSKIVKRVVLTIRDSSNREVVGSVVILRASYLKADSLNQTQVSRALASWRDDHDVCAVVESFRLMYGEIEIVGETF